MPFASQRSRCRSQLHHRNRQLHKQHGHDRCVRGLMQRSAKMRHAVDSAGMTDCELQLDAPTRARAKPQVYLSVCIQSKHTRPVARLRQTFRIETIMEAVGPLTIEREPASTRNQQHFTRSALQDAGPCCFGVPGDNLVGAPPRDQAILLAVSMPTS